jgi:hypothetical protein
MSNDNLTKIAKNNFVKPQDSFYEVRDFQYFRSIIDNYNVSCIFGMPIKFDTLMIITYKMILLSQTSK